MEISIRFIKIVKRLFIKNKLNTIKKGMIKILIKDDFCIMQESSFLNI